MTDYQRTNEADERGDDERTNGTQTVEQTMAAIEQHYGGLMRRLAEGPDGPAEIGGTDGEL